jgi:cysteine desulfuration protein SufE
MAADDDTVAVRVNRIAADFAELEPRERLELLLEFAERLPPLPDKYKADRDAGLHRVRECQTPVFIWVELADSRVELIADVAPEAPTVKGFVSLLREAFQGEPAAEVVAVEQDLVKRLGLLESLGMVRMRGLVSILFAVRRQVQAALAKDADA